MIYASSSKLFWQPSVTIYSRRLRLSPHWMERNYPWLLRQAVRRFLKKPILRRRYRSSVVKGMRMERNMHGVITGSFPSTNLRKQMKGPRSCSVCWGLSTNRIKCLWLTNARHLLCFSSGHWWPCRTGACNKAFFAPWKICARKWICSSACGRSDGMIVRPAYWKRLYRRDRIWRSGCGMHWRTTGEAPS